MLLLTIMGGGLMGCTEEIDESNRYTFTEETVLSYLEKQPEYSDYVRLLRAVPISDYSDSNVAQLLSARGHFTCFVPTNDAIQLYLDSLQRKGIINPASWEGFPNDGGRTLDSIQKVIVYNSIIDGGDVKYYETTDFPKTNDEEFDIANMNDRKLSVVRGQVNTDSIFINGEAPLSMKNRDIEAINGRIHEVAAVIAPSNDTMFDILRRWIEDGNSGYTVTAKLLLACGLGDTLKAYRDETWEHLYLTGVVEDLPSHNTFGQVGSLPAHRKFGFTVFAETDDVWRELFPNVEDIKDITPEMVRDYLETTQWFPDADKAKRKNFEDEDNILNQFVTYHVLPERISRNCLVVHFREKGYDYLNPTMAFTIPISDFYTTMGKPRLLKVYESRESNGIYLNRFPVLRNGRGKFSLENAPDDRNRNDYHESGEFKPIFGIAVDADENQGIAVLTASEAGVSNESFLNGLFYPIRKLLVCTENVRRQMKNQRIRIDAATLFPEMMSNDLRGIKSFYTEGSNNCRAFPVNYQYLANVEMKAGTQFYYLPGFQRNWCNNEGDEFNVIGRYEFTMKLPPVPEEGHYELRFGVATGTQWRGMCQVYWGTDKNNLPARGIPMDLRMGGQYRRLVGLTQPSIVGWEEDTDDEEYNDEVTKKMRNIGFMKGPESWTDGTVSVRQREYVTRRILISEDMKPNTDYYIKFKSVLDDKLKEFFMDYIEYCAKEVYDNPNESEDIW